MYDSRRSLGDKTFRWEYDALNRVTKETYPDGNYLQYTCDALGRRTQLRDPDGNLTTSTYNATTLRLASTQHPFSGTTDYAYNAYGELTGIDYENGTSVRYVYDGLGRVTEVNNLDMIQDPLCAISYTYNDNSNIT